MKLDKDIEVIFSKNEFLNLVEYEERLAVIIAYKMFIDESKNFKKLKLKGKEYQLVLDSMHIIEKHLVRDMAANLDLA